MVERKNVGGCAPPQIQQLMKTLQITEAEAKEVLEYDKRIDAGEKLGELDSDKKKVAKAMTLTGTRAKGNYKFQQNENRD